MEEEDYWTKSDVKKFNFDEDDGRTFSVLTRNDQKLIIDDNVSEISYEMQPNTEIPMHLIISDQDLHTILEEQSLKESPLPKNISVEDELKILRRKTQERYHAPPAAAAITQMLMKKPCSLHCFRGIHEKEALLDEAIVCGDGDAILTVLLFLQQTLKTSHFNRIIQCRPEAIRHYVNYMLQRFLVAECSDFLTMLGRPNESAMVQYEMAMRLSKSSDTKKHKLNKIFNEHFATHTGSVHPFYTQTIVNYISLLEWQLSEKIHNPRLKNILDASVLESLFHACANYKWSGHVDIAKAPATVASSGSSSSSSSSPIIAPSARSTPHKFAESFKVAQSQFDWIALNERSQCQAWRDLETIFEKKSWTTLKTAKTFSIAVPLDRAILQLHAMEAPVAVLNMFLAHIDEPHRRLALARKTKAGKSIVDALVELKDRQQLELFLIDLDVGTDVRFYAENALKNLVATKSKWKGDGLKILKS